MSAIESPEQMALRLCGRRDQALAAHAIRERDEQLRKALLVLATEWKTTAPLSSGGYVEGLLGIAASLGGTGR